VGEPFLDDIHLFIIAFQLLKRLRKSDPLEKNWRKHCLQKKWGELDHPLPPPMLYINKILGF